MVFSPIESILDEEEVGFFAKREKIGESERENGVCVCVKERNL